MEETQILTNHLSGTTVTFSARTHSPGKETNILESSFARVHGRRKRIQQFLFMLFRMAAIINGIGLFVVVFFIAGKGWKAITWEFLTQAPTDSMTKGGILPCIVGTLCLGIGAIVVALPIGVASAIYLNEYARPGRVLRLIRLGISNLAGVPSVVFGLFGLAFFVIWMGMGECILAGVLTLGGADAAGHHRLDRGSAEIRAQYVPGGFAGPGRHQMADHLPGGASGRPSGHPDGRDSGPQPGRRRNSADHVYGGGVFHADAAHVAIQQNHGAAVSYLCSGDCRNKH